MKGMIIILQIVEIKNAFNTPIPEPIKTGIPSLTSPIGSMLINIP